MRLLHLTVRRTPDFRNTNGMEQKTVTWLFWTTESNCSDYPDFWVGAARTEQLTLPIFTWLEVETTDFQSCQVSRFSREFPGFRADLQVSRLVLKISRILRSPLKWSFMHGLAPDQPVCWANKASRAIFANYDNFVRNCVNFVGNFVISGKFVLCSEKFWYVRKNFFDP
jgi:hypothetical protein